MPRSGRAEPLCPRWGLSCRYLLLGLPCPGPHQRRGLSSREGGKLGQTGILTGFTVGASEAGETRAPPCFRIALGFVPALALTGTVLPEEPGWAACTETRGGGQLQEGNPPPNMGRPQGARPGHILPQEDHQGGGGVSSTLLGGRSSRFWEFPHFHF